MDPEQGKTLLTSEPTAPAAVVAALPQPPLSAQAKEPVADPPVFDLEQELAQLEKETKVRLVQRICIPAYDTCAPVHDYP